ncbi:4'-phosphopantetheinyl transferase family protein [Piscinibacter terrae]|uniref:4'-phosphopantetheinyl transferase family protein n=1 Tax=Piscinibacter terrae TaxID=2496871 RepID=UPI00138698DD|nr:4'-phosphopantetheinyl transferase superfamily protein [Albitalea terrae]
MPECLTLCRNRVDLWLAQTSRVRALGLLDRCGLLLSAEELAREARFRFQEDRDSFRVTRALLRCVLSRYAAKAETSWRFESDANGRPRLADADAFSGELDFSISHTRDFTLVAIGLGRRVGVDIERADRQVRESVRWACLDADERTACALLHEDTQPRRFIETWTLKESYLKALGCGLSRPMDSFGFRFIDDAGIALCDPCADATSAATWAFSMFDLPQAHVGSVCIEDGSAVDLVLHRMEPLATDVEMALQIIRGSATQ